MAKIFITGSSDGLGLLAAEQLVKNGHRVTLHARNAQRAKDAQSACPGAENVLIGDLSSMQQTKQLAADANAMGTFDCVIHNAGIYRGGFRKTEDRLPSLIAVNIMAPYVLTCLMNKPKRLVYLSSDSHYGGDASLKDLTWKERGESAWSDNSAYSDSKLCNNLLANAFARLWPDVPSNSFHPGWMATKMGGSVASKNFKASIDTYVMLAEGEGQGAETGKYFETSRREGSPQSGALSRQAQDKLLKICEEVTGVAVPT